MDSIDITDSAFSLEMPDMNNIVDASGLVDTVGNTDYTVFMYVGVTLLIGLIGYLIYKNYEHKKIKQSEIDDCPGGFCTLNQQSNRVI